MVITFKHYKEDLRVIIIHSLRSELTLFYSFASDVNAIAFYK